MKFCNTEFLKGKKPHNKSAFENQDLSFLMPFKLKIFQLKKDRLIFIQSNLEFCSIYMIFVLLCFADNTIWKEISLTFLWLHASFSFRVWAITCLCACLYACTDWRILTKGLCHFATRSVLQSLPFWVLGIFLKKKHNGLGLLSPSLYFSSLTAQLGWRSSCIVVGGEGTGGDDGGECERGKGGIVWDHQHVPGVTWLALKHRPTEGGKAASCGCFVLFVHPSLPLLFVLTYGDQSVNARCERTLYKSRVDSWPRWSWRALNPVMAFPAFPWSVIHADRLLQLNDPINQSGDFEKLSSNTLVPLAHRLAWALSSICLLLTKN